MLPPSEQAESARTVLREEFMAQAAELQIRCLWPQCRFEADSPKHQTSERPQTAAKATGCRELKPGPPVATPMSKPCVVCSVVQALDVSAAADLAELCMLSG